MDKTIGILTIHTTFNYGAVLQAYATQAFFTHHGYDAELVDYTNSHIQEQLRLSYKQDGKWKGYFITFLRNTLFGRLHYYKKAFRNIRQICRFSAKVYATSEDLNGTSYDILVAGSDQIWNPEICGGLDPAFFLQHGHAKRKISMASSMGSALLSEKEKAQLRDWLKDFDNISVREAFAKRQIQELTNKPVKILLDPTLLLPKNYWIRYVVGRSRFNHNGQEYIVTYFAGGNKGSHREIIAQYARRMKLPVWTIQYSNYTWKESSRKILGASMEDFVALIANAALVITDSFHGVAFSVNLETDFVALTNTANPIRVMNFLDKLDLTERIDMSPECFEEVDYEKVRPKLEDLRADSIKWVLEAVEG